MKQTMAGRIKKRMARTVPQTASHRFYLWGANVVLSILIGLIWNMYNDLKVQLASTTATVYAHSEKLATTSVNYARTNEDIRDIKSELKSITGNLTDIKLMVMEKTRSMEK